MSAAPVTATVESIGTPALWILTIAAVVLLVLVDFLITRRPHEVRMREAIVWSVFYVSLPLAFGLWVWQAHGSDLGVQYYTGYLVEKALSVDNLFVFMVLMASFTVPRELQQRVLLIGVAGALVLRAVFIAAGAQLIATFSWTFLVFGLVLLATAVKVARDSATHAPTVEVSRLRSMRLVRRFWPVTDSYAGTALTVPHQGRRALTPLALVVIAILATDVVFAIDSVPAIFGITGDPYLVFATNAFALLGLRALYFVIEAALAKLTHLGFGLAVILAFIGVKLTLHWAHEIWPTAPQIPTVASLAVVIGVLATVTMTSLLADRSTPVRASDVPTP